MTLNKSEALFSPSTRYRDLALVADGDSLAAGAGDTGGVDAGEGVGGLAFDPLPIASHNACAMAETADDLIRLLREHAPDWSERFGVRSLRIFGSWARGSATP